MLDGYVALFDVICARYIGFGDVTVVAYTYMLINIVGAAYWYLPYIYAHTICPLCTINYNYTLVCDASCTMKSGKNK